MRPNSVDLAQRAFASTAAYDRAVFPRLARESNEDRSGLPAYLDIRAPPALDLRYGENPHQKAALYSIRHGGLAAAEQLQGKELSYNNLVDLDAAWQLIREFDQPAAAIIKHTNPCGCAEESTLAESYRRAFEADPVRRSAVCWRSIGPWIARPRGNRQDLCRSHCRAWLFPLRAILAAKKNLRLLAVAARRRAVMKSISGGYLCRPRTRTGWTAAHPGEDGTRPNR